MSAPRKVDTRFAISIALCIASVIAAFAISYFSQRSQSMWITTRTIPAGVALSSQDIRPIAVQGRLTRQGYFPYSTSPIGWVTRRTISSGELLHSSAVTQDAQRSMTNISLAVRPSDIPTTVGVGDTVAIYQLHDVRTGEPEVSPIEVLPHAFISRIERKSSNLSSDLIVTLVISDLYLPQLLQSTTSGRLVLVSAGS
jgi:hypothetical protein